MPEPEFNLLSINRGTVMAPAGCGKTHLIAEALKLHEEPKPILILTHTNSGVVALRARLDNAGIPSRAYRLSTIDGWAMRLISMFPARSGHDPDILKLEDRRNDYLNIRTAAAKLLKAGHVNELLAATYARLIVDEYQDCSIRQHCVIGYASNTLKTCVLGDPMQAIFGFGNDKLAKWDEHVCAHFPVVRELGTPWRWKNAGTEPLGLWLLAVRRKLMNGEPIDLRTAPAGMVNWIHLDGKQDHALQLKAGRVKTPGGVGHVLIIGESTSPDSQRRFASQTPGAIAIEAVDLHDLVQFASDLNLAAPDALNRVVCFAQSVMVNAGGAELLRRVQSIRNGTNRNPPTAAEAAAVAFSERPSYRQASVLLAEIGRQAGVHSHRPDILRACMRALQTCTGTEGSGFYDSAIQMREQNRLLGRPLPRRAVGSTLLLKGLEAEVTVILNAHTLNAKNLYVAMTRGSKLLIVCSPTPILNPRG